MSYRTRKLRRRSQAFPGDDETPAIADAEVQPLQNMEDSQSNGSEDLSDEHRKEDEVWNAFKEENHEVLEQLPLSLHRQLKLIRELDVQNEALHRELLSSVRRYAEFRKHLMRMRQTVTLQGYSQELACLANRPVDSNGSSQVPVNGGDSSATDLSNRPHVASLFQPEAGETTQSILQHIAHVSEESLRTAEEKVSIAQTAYETVDRHIRLLDQAVKEQEAAISLGMRPGTHLAPILLPDIVAVPRWARPSRVEHSPLALTPEPESPSAPIVLHESVTAVPPSVKKGKKVIPRESEPKEETAPAVPAEPAKTRRGVKLTLRAPPPGPSVEPTLPPDPNEKRYCHCNQVSFGTMIACDNENCKLEWFHLGCTGLSELPSKKSKWYCRDCRPKMMHKAKPRS